MILVLALRGYDVMMVGCSCGDSRRVVVALYCFEVGFGIVQRVVLHMMLWTVMFVDVMW